MKLLIIARGYPTHKDSVNGNFEYELALALASHGLDIIYAFIDRRTFSSVKRKFGLSKIKDDKIRVYGGFLFPLTYRLFPRLSTWLYSRRYKSLFKKIIHNEGMPDIIHSHYLVNLPCAVALKRKYKIPIVATEHWSAIQSEKLPFYVKYLSKYYSDVDYLVSVSNSLSETLEKKFYLKSKVINNMVADDFIMEITKLQFEEDKSKDNKVRIFSIGSLIHRKGYDLLIDACNNLNAKYTNWELNIVGNGPLEKDLLYQIQSRGLSNKIHLLGAKNKKEIISFLNKAHFFVLPSRSETFGVVYIEAMAMGVPVIATICGGPEEFVNNSVGVLIEKNNLESLSNALIYMYDHYREYDRTAIRQYVYNNFSSSVISQKYLGIYEHLNTKL